MNDGRVAACGTSRRESPARWPRDRCSSPPSPRCPARRSRPASAPSRGTSTPCSSTTRSSPDVMSSTPCRALITGALARRQRRVLGPRLADGDEGRGLGQPVDVRDLQPSSPSMRSMVAAAGGAPAVSTRTPRGTSARDSSGAFASPMSTVGAAQSMVIRSRRDRARRHGAGSTFAQADVRAADGRDGPDEGPAVGVKHRQRPQVAIGRGHVEVHQRADAVHPGVAMRDHHALRPRRRAARVVDGEQIALVEWPGARTRARRPPASAAS